VPWIETFRREKFSSLDPLRDFAQQQKPSGNKCEPTLILINKGAIKPT
jgi:hypothetical protein